MREDLMRELRRVTEEEEQLLAGGQVDKSLYTSGGGFLIDSDKLLAKGKLITVRPPTPGLPPSPCTPTTTWRLCTCARARPSTR